MQSTPTMISSLPTQLNTVMAGKSLQVRDCVTCLLAGGHLLIEDRPGVGKTTLARLMAEAFDAQQKAWEAELRADKDMGGQAFEANVSVARRAIERFGSPALKQLLNDTGLGNHPELARFALRVGRALAEDSVAGASAAPQATQSEDAMLALLYPSMSRKEK